MVSSGGTRSMRPAYLCFLIQARRHFNNLTGRNTE